MPGKTEILEAILVRGMEGALYTFTDALARSAPGEELDTLVDCHVRQVLGVHGRLVPIYSRDIVYLPADVQERLATGRREIMYEWVAALRGRVPSLSKDDADALANLYVGVVGDVIGASDLRARPHVAADLIALANAILLPDELVHRR